MGGWIREDDRMRQNGRKRHREGGLMERADGGGEGGKKERQRVESEGEKKWGGHGGEETDAKRQE